jgi:hypothetical protein
MICPNLKCGKTVVAADSARGKVVRCVHCRSAFMVPKNAPVAAPPPAQKEPGDSKKKQRR